MIERFEKLDIVVNNAGKGMEGKITDLSSEGLARSY
ncbi:hypothetical protein [Psychrobacter sp. KH172YL61]|nr:hypothetical protein [Psychrobacter sp. KH172YL61]